MSQPLITDCEAIISSLVSATMNGKAPEMIFARTSEQCDNVADQADQLNKGFNKTLKMFHNMAGQAVLDGCKLLKRAYVELHGRIAFNKLVLTPIPDDLDYPENFNPLDPEVLRKWKVTKSVRKGEIYHALLARYDELLEVTLGSDLATGFGFAYDGHSPEDVIESVVICEPPESVS